MNFRVRWSKRALGSLAQIWLQADSPTRQAVTDASRQIDNLLSIDPFAKSDSREQRQRVLLVATLGTIFRLEEDEKTISVLKG
jgi:hypothetical protein